MNELFPFLMKTRGLKTVFLRHMLESAPILGMYSMLLLSSSINRYVLLVLPLSTHFFEISFISHPDLPPIPLLGNRKVFIVNLRLFIIFLLYCLRILFMHTLYFD